MPAIPLNSVVHCEKCEKQNKWNTKRSRGRTQRRQKRMKTKKKNTNVHMLRCLECAILHLRDFVPHTHTVKQTVKHTGTLEQWNTEAHTHTHAKRGKSIRNQSTRQGFHSVRKQTVDSRQARPGWGFLVLFGRSFGGGLGCFSGASFFFAACGPSSSWKRKCGLIYSTRLLARLFPTAANIFFCTTPAKIFLSP